MRWLTGLVAAGLIVAAGPAGAEKVAQELELDRVIAVINRDVVLASELDRRMLQQTTTKNAADPRRAMLWAMIDERLLVQRGLSSQLTATETEIERALDEVRKQNGLTKEQLLEELKRVGYSIDDYRQSVARQLIVQKVLNFEVRASLFVTDEDVKKLYDRRVAAADDKPTAKLEDVKDALRAELYSQRLDLERDRLLVELRAGAFIDIRLPKGAKK